MGPSPRPPAPARSAAAAALILCTAALLRFPQAATEAAREGLRLCAGVILPSLFPFFVLSSLVVRLDFARPLGKLLAPVMGPLFRLSGPCASALALGLVGGYPVGARTAGELVASGACSRQEGERLLSFCNNCGPAFLLGAVGVGVFRSPAAGLALYAVHVSAALLTGVLLRGSGRFRAVPAQPPAPPARLSFADAFTGAVDSALRSVLAICAFVVFFSVLSRLLSLSGLPAALAACLAAPLGLPPEGVEGALMGLLEVTTGVLSLTGGPLTFRLVAAAALTGWGGVCVHCQALSCLGSSGLSVRPYFLGKALHGLLSGVLMALLLRLLPRPTATVFSPAVVPAALPSLKGVLVLYALVCVPLVLLWLLAAALEKKEERRREKKSGKKGGGRV